MDEVIENQEEVIQFKDKPSITITIQSWATPVVGLAMLVLGLLGGYFGRPLLAPQSSQVAADPSTTASDAGNPPARQEALMEAFVAQTRHFKGSSDAPVTILEFGDFQ